jgi:threonine dehydratase
MAVNFLPVTAADVTAAAQRIQPHVRQTPLLSVSGSSHESGFASRGVSLCFKLEFLQHAGSFKPRGAFNSLLSSTVPTVGVAAASGGNHGAAVAFAAQQLGHHATIFVPEIASPAKIEAIRRFGATVNIGGVRYNDALERCEAFVARTGALSVHAFDTRETIAGQGTVALEWDRQIQMQSLRPLTTVLVAVGGGGLIAGMAAFWASNDIQMIGVEPSGSRALHAALVAGSPVDVDVTSIAADSLGAKRIGTMVHAITSRAVADVVLVDDAAIVAAQRQLWADYRIAAEPGGAAALAALTSGAYKPKDGEHVGVLLCGANVDLQKLAQS